MIAIMETVITLLVAGAALLLLETILPGMIAGIVGLICLLIGVVLAYNYFGARSGNLILSAVVIALIAGTLSWIKFFPRSRLGRVFVSQRAVGEIRAEKPELVHQTGTALSHLRPSGTAVIGGKRVDVVTEGAHVERGTPIKVIAVEGMRVVVRAI
jgi:membrane-bound serine protease (ClpP class)